MSITLSPNEVGNLEIPKSALDQLRSATDGKFEVTVMNGRIEITPEDQAPAPNARLEKRGKRRVIVGLEPFNAAEAVMASREDQVRRHDFPRS